MEWYMQMGGPLVNISDEKNAANQLDLIKESLLICESCYESGNLPKGLFKDNFEPANFFNIVNPSESKMKK
jgi:hypothetical protein